MSEQLTRREVIRIAGAAAAIGAFGGMGAAAQSANAAPPVSAKPKTRLLRVAHLTDVHVQPERNANSGMLACVRHAQAIDDPPQLILFGGDSVMDSFEADDARTQVQWDLWRSVLKNDCGVRVQSCIGNHDIWGWNKERSRTTGKEPNYGKNRAVECLQLDHRYYSFTLGWHFIVLDSVQSDGAAGYRAFLDDEQFDWLQRELRASNPQIPIVILSHIPIQSASAILWAKRDERQDYHISGSLLHQDSLKLKDLFAKHQNVKLCLSGHLHLLDRVDYNGVSYLCNGAVSGNWWKGRYKDCDEGYAMIDLYDDGSFEHQYVAYGWKARR